jgi:ribosomal protein S18 acetylase RimI-like enzyme
LTASKEIKDELPIRTRLKIRTARPNDAAEIAKILAETFAEYKSLYTPEAFAMMTPGKDEIEKRFSEAGRIWVAALEGEIVGTVSVVNRNESLYIRSLAILPAAQGLRIGERLLTEVENYSVAGGFKILTLSTGAFLPRALRLYDKFGFTQRGVGDFYGTRLIAMEKRLG